ncbi:recombinase RecT, partial [Campylobacter sputorum]|uniref:recombinase RecT n=1 Tax=Campylobacter sputorum TaxID=206 RepID=UPI00053BF377
MSNAVKTREAQANELIRAKQAQIQLITGDKARASTFMTTLANMANDYNLRNCSVESIVNAGLEIVRLGLNPNKTFGQAYVVPFRLKNGGETAQLQIGYKGWIGLSYRNGWVFRAVSVYKCDDFKIEFAGIKDNISFNPNYDASDRDESNGEWIFENLKGVIVYAKDKQDNEFSEFVPFKKLEKIRQKSQNQNNKNKLEFIWADWAEEMYKAKAIKYVATRLPLLQTYKIL